MPLSEFPLPNDDSSGDELPEIRVPVPGPLTQSAIARLERLESPAFANRRDARAERSGERMPPIVLTSGRGSNVYDADGNRYVDLASGFGSVLLGHAATSVQRALEGQADRLTQALGDVYSADTKIALLERLAAIFPCTSPRVLLGLSGSDAITAAIKTAMLATGRPGIVAFEGAYHGLGYAPLAACGLRESYRAPFAAQLNAHVRFVSFPGAGTGEEEIAALEEALRPGDVGAVLLEPILGRGGCVVPPDAFVRGVCEVAHRHGALVIADEIWTGLGRCGSLLRSLALEASVDIVCLGKGLGGGLPLSACIGPDAIFSAWARSEAQGEVVHTSTHAGYPLACATAVATLDTIRFRQLVTRSHDVGERALQRLTRELSASRGVVAIRGAGLMIGIELESGEAASRAMGRMLAQGYIVLTGGQRGETITLTPALTISEDLLAGAANALRAAL